MKMSIVFAVLTATACCLVSATAEEYETKVVLRDYLKQAWTNELLTYPFSAHQGECLPESVTLTGPQGQPVAVQLSNIEYWPNTKAVNSAKLSFIANLAPLATDTYMVRYGNTPAAPPATDLRVTPATDRVEVVTRQFGARLLLGEHTYATPVEPSQVPAPVLALRMADGTWFGGSAMVGSGKLKSYSAQLTDNGPVFARVAVRYTYETGNTLDVFLRMAAGDNTIRCETRVKNDQPDDGFCWVLSRGLTPLRFQVQMESYCDREQFPKWVGSSPATFQWTEIPLADYAGPKDRPGLVTQLSPWEDWFSSFTQTRIRLKLQNTTRELQIRSQDPGAWVEPVPLDKSLAGTVQPTPGNSYPHKMLPVLKGPSGEILLRVNAAMGVRKWTVSDCLSVPGAAPLYTFDDAYKPESSFPPETRPTVGERLNEVKEYVLDWPGDAGTHPRLFVSRSELQSRWKSLVVDPAALEQCLKYASLKSADQISYTPKWDEPLAVGAYLLSRGDPNIARQTLLPARLRKALDYELWGMQFGSAGNLTPILYDCLIDSSSIPDQDRAVLRSRMAWFGYRLADPGVWSLERGYCSGNPNMTHTWELSRGLVACTIPEHPMARTWFRNAELIMEQTLAKSVGSSGEFTEPIGRHGRVDTLVAFAIAATRAGLHDYANDLRLKRLMLHYVKMLTPRDPRPRATPGYRYLPAWGRDCMGGVDGTVGVMARFMRQHDPEYSANLQWAWVEGGADSRFDLLGGFEYLLCDRQLPARMPTWTSEVFPRLGAVLRHGLATSDEHQVTLFAGAGMLYPSQNGALASIFAYGTPLAGSFAGGYEYQEGLLTCHVDLARPRGDMNQRQQAFYSGHAGDVAASWLEGPIARFGERAGWANVSAFSTLPRQDYAAVDVAFHHRRNINFIFPAMPEWPPVPANGTPPLDWRRQTLFFKDVDPGKAGNYLLIRDSVKGVKSPQPTMWQMWTATETVDTPETVQGLHQKRVSSSRSPQSQVDTETVLKDVAAVAANKPGYKVLPYRQLKGNRFTGIGQFGVDVEYYIASPADTPRYTLRWGTEMSGPNTKLREPEYQDLLHLQLPGDGAYYVAFFPRKRQMPAPAFSTLGGGTIIKVEGDFGTDYGFLSALDVAAAGEGVTFRGTAASVQDRKGGLVLCLGAKGAVGYKNYRLAADFPVALHVREKKLVVELPATVQPPAFAPAQPFPGGTVTVTSPGDWTLARPHPGATLTQSASGFVLEVPPGLKELAILPAN